MPSPDADNPPANDLSSTISTYAQAQADAGKRTYSGFPRAFGDYTLIRPIGLGGFGEVFLARHDRTWQMVAIKTLSKKRKDDAAAVARFELEIRIGTELRHPNILPVINHGEAGGIQFLTMPFVDGADLLKQLAKRPAPGRQAAQFLLPIAQAVQYAHEHGYLHCDIKPSNILVERTSNKAFIADFGLAKDMRRPTSTEEALQVAGTQEYMPPEQADPFLIDRNDSPALDVYGLGVTLYEMITGCRPFPRPDRPRRDLPYQIAWYAPLPPSALNPQVHPDLDRICLVCLQKSPYHRYQTAGELANDLKRFAKGQPVEARMPSKARRFWLGCRRRRKLTAAMTALLVTTAATSFAAFDYSRQAERQKLIATSQEAAKEEARSEAVARKQAEDRARHAERLRTYLADMQSLPRLWDQGDLTAMQRILESHRPSGGADMRGFEWYYWRNALAANCSRLENGEACHALAISPSNRYVAASDGRAVTLWDLDTSERLHTWQVDAGQPAPSWRIDRLSDRSLAFSPNGRLLAATVSFHDGTTSPSNSKQYRAVGSLWVWNVETGEERLSVVQSDKISGRAVAFAPKGRFVVAGGFSDLWYAWRVNARRDASTPAEFTPDITNANQLVTNDRASIEARLATFGCTDYDAVKDLRFDAEGGVLMAWSREMPSRWVWLDAKRLSANDESAQRGGWFVESDTTTGVGILTGRKTRVSHKTFSTSVAPLATMDHMDDVRCAAIGDDHVVAGCPDNIVRLWTFNSMANHWNQRPMEFRGAASPIVCVAAGTKLTACCDSGGTITIWQRDGRHMARLNLQAPSPEVARRRDDERTIAVSESGSLACESGPALGEWRVVRLPDRETLVQLTSCGINAEASFSPTGRHLVLFCRFGHGTMIGDGSTVSGLPTAYLYDVETAELVTALSAHALVAVSGPRFSRDGSRLLLADGRGAHVFDASTGEELVVVPTEDALMAELSPCGRYIAAGGHARWSIWDTQADAVLCGGSDTPTRIVFLAPEQRAIVEVTDPAPRVFACDLVTNESMSLETDASPHVAALSVDGRRFYLLTSSVLNVYSTELSSGLLLAKIPVEARPRSSLELESAVRAIHTRWVSREDADPAAPPRPDEPE